MLRLVSLFSRTSSRVSVSEFDEITRTDTRKKHIAQYKDNIHSAVSAQFNDIIEEVGKRLFVNMF